MFHPRTIRLILAIAIAFPILLRASKPLAKRLSDGLRGFSDWIDAETKGGTQEEERASAQAKASLEFEAQGGFSQIDFCCS
jgi:hypothetical protein